MRNWELIKIPIYKVTFFFYHYFSDTAYIIPVLLPEVRATNGLQTIVVQIHSILEWNRRNSSQQSTPAFRASLVPCAFLDCIYLGSARLWYPGSHEI